MNPETPDLDDETDPLTLAVDSLVERSKSGTPIVDEDPALQTAVQELWPDGFYCEGMKDIYEDDVLELARNLLGAEGEFRLFYEQSEALLADCLRLAPEALALQQELKQRLGAALVVDKDGQGFDIGDIEDEALERFEADSQNDPELVLALARWLWTVKGWWENVYRDEWLQYADLNHSRNGQQAILLASGNLTDAAPGCVIGVYADPAEAERDLVLMGRVFDPNGLGPFFGYGRPWVPRPFPFDLEAVKKAMPPIHRR